MAKLTTEKFIAKAKAVHGDRYDYSKVEYVNNNTPVEIFCRLHGAFWQTPHNHNKGKGCPICGGKKKISNRDFIKRAQEIHGDKYDYSKSVFKKVTEKVCIICPLHGEFWQEPRAHFGGCGCPKCGKEKAALARNKSNEDFLKEAHKVHGNKYDYSKTKYVDAKTKVCITCKVHGDFMQVPYHHLHGCGCPKCQKEHAASLQRKTNEWFLQKAHEVHGDRYDYSKVEYVNSLTKVCIICKKHGEFWQIPSSHISGHGCVKCSTDRSIKYNKEICLTTARTCTSRVEFVNKYRGMVECAKRNGWYEECCAHMGTRGNKQRVIYAYEFEEAHAAYIGLTFKMEVRNKRHHKEGAVFEFAKLHGIEIPKPRILTDYMDQEEASIQEGVWLQKYKDWGWMILNRLKTGSLGGQELLDYDIAKIEDSMQGYDKLDDWDNSHSSYREYIRQHNLDYLLDKHFPDRMRRIYDDYEECRKAYSQCESIRQVHDIFPGALAAAKRHGWHKELSELCRASKVKFTREIYMALVSKYKTLKEFRHEQKSAYNRIVHNGWNDLLEPLVRELHPDYNFSIEEIKAFCENAGEYKTLKANHPEILNYCWYKKIDIYELTGWKRSNLRPVRLLRDGIVIATFPSSKGAADYVGISNKKLGKYIDTGKEYHGYVWESDK